MMDIVFRLARPLPLLNVQLRQHWAKRGELKKDLAWEVLAELGRSRPATPLPFAEVKIWRHSTQAPDYDNLIASAKNLLDVLQPASKRHPYGLGVIEGDDAARLRLAVHHIQASARTAQHTLVRIRPLTGLVMAAALPVSVPGDDGLSAAGRREGVAA